MSSVRILVVNVYIESCIFCRYIMCTIVLCRYVLVSMYHCVGVDIPYSFYHKQYRTVAVWVVVPSRQINEAPVMFLHSSEMCACLLFAVREDSFLLLRFHADSNFLLLYAFIQMCTGI